MKCLESLTYDKQTDVEKAEFLCVISAMHVIFCTQEDRFYIHTFTLTEYDSYKYQGY